jgi:hypothetical protein
MTNLKAALTASIFTANNVYFSLQPEESLSYPPGDKFAVIQPTALDLAPKGGRTFGPGTGRVNLLVSWECTIWLFVRLNLDQYNRSDKYLTDTTLGSLPVTDAIIDALQSYTVQDGSSANYYGYELDSVRWKTMKDKEGVGWAVTQMNYHTDLTGR